MGSYQENYEGEDRFFSQTKKKRKKKYAYEHQQQNKGTDWGCPSKKMQNENLPLCKRVESFTT